MRAPGGVLLVSCYELGHAPHGLALPLAFLERAGFRPAAVDASVVPLADAELARAAVVAIAVPMHTALRLGVRAARRARAVNPSCHLCFYGLYAPLNAAYLRQAGAESVLGGEHEAALVRLVEAVAAGAAPPAEPAVALERLDFPQPARALLPRLDKYAKLAAGGRERLAGYTEATRGCKHMCRHCPIPPVYGGRFFAVAAETVIADAAAQVEAGAEHITFGDPDFFNGPRHGLAILRALHARFPALTFDVTIKVEHLLTQRAHLGELVELGCAFAVTAAESLSDTVLAHLRKGHSRADFAAALALARGAGLVLRPTFVPFTPWSALADLVDLVDFIEREDLIDHVDPVQLTIRLLVPPGSLLLADPALRPCFGELDPAGLSHRWRHPDPRVDELQRALAGAVERAAAQGEDPARTFAALRALVYRAAERIPPAAAAPRPRGRVPRLTEPWFC